MPRHLIRAVVVAGYAALALAFSGAVPPADAAPGPTRHVICGKRVNWVPIDYDGCLITFTDAIKKYVYTSWGLAELDAPDWAGADYADAHLACTRGGTVNGMALERNIMGTCTWDERYTHPAFQNPDGSDHPAHSWYCTVRAIATMTTTGTRRYRLGREWMKWEIHWQPIEQPQLQGGVWPTCSKARDATDDWLGLPTAGGAGSGS